MNNCRVERVKSTFNINNNFSGIEQNTFKIKILKNLSATFEHNLFTPNTILHFLNNNKVFDSIYSDICTVNIINSIFVLSCEFPDHELY